MNEYGARISCPLCRGSFTYHHDLSRLANNPYAIQMVRSKLNTSSSNAL